MNIAEIKEVLLNHVNDNIKLNKKLVFPSLFTGMAFGLVVIEALKGVINNPIGSAKFIGFIILTIIFTFFTFMQIYTTIICIKCTNEKKLIEMINTNKFNITAVKIINKEYEDGDVYVKIVNEYNKPYTKEYKLYPRTTNDVKDAFLIEFNINNTVYSLVIHNIN